ncbi:MAG: tRNA (adenosine(37)-N6)-dimethylallyltransferase MiaA [Anaerofustis sp.]
MNLFIALAGPTGSGKTSLSIELAKYYSAEIVSADAYQIYRHMDIGTAKISKEDRSTIPHYMIDEFNPEENVSVSEYTKRANRYIDTILKDNKIPLLVGGSGLYMDSIIYRSYTYSSDAVDQSYRNMLIAEYAEKGTEWLYLQLNTVDPEYAMITHPNNVKRVLRALEYYHATGQKKSSIEQKKEYRYPPTIYFAIRWDTSILYERINKRVDTMIDNGLIEEVIRLIESGCKEQCNSMQAIGYKELIPVIEGKISPEAAIEKIKQNSRNYAKRQMTWFRRNPDIIWIDGMKYPSEQDMLKFVKGYIDEIRYRNNATDFGM